MVRISQTRIRSINRISPFLTGKLVAFGIPLQDAWDKLQKIWFPQNPSDGTTILPAVVWAVTRFNAEGKEKVRRDLPKESHTRELEYNLPDWRGGAMHTGVVDITYMRYPRDFIPPADIDLTISDNRIVSPVFNVESQWEDIIHTVNMFLEIFQSCDILDENLEDIQFLKSERLNWEILPEWPMPWERFEKVMRPILERQKLQTQLMFRKRFETIEKHKPDFYAAGKAGFSGYVIFGFKDKNLFLCESMRHGNALYVFEENWKELSKKTKAEILKWMFQKDRIIHYADWQKKIHQLLSKNK